VVRVESGGEIDEEALALALVDEGVLVHPGFFFEFEDEAGAAHLVTALLSPPAVFADGVERLLRGLRGASAVGRL
jgi:hypothetical protein